MLVSGRDVADEKIVGFRFIRVLVFLVFGVIF